MSMVTVGIISGGFQVVSGILGFGSAKRRERDAKNRAAALNAKLTSLENNRQAIVNPYSNVKDLSSLASDLSGELSNPFANLSVATQAAEIQFEQSDMALANTLDTIRATGASAGGATALAQAALQSKKGISADIEKQEVANEKLRAQGEQQLDSMKLQEKQRQQSVALSEGQRMQGADAAGQQFMFNAQEGREMQQLNRVAAQLSGAQQQQMQASSDKMGAITGAIGGLTSIAGSFMAGGGEIPKSGYQTWKTDAMNAAGGMGAYVNTSRSAYRNR
tara:strand:- start:10 stop:840 length:831 start_codon:yes stop_codon:yes gene_type:complete